MSEKHYKHLFTLFSLKTLNIKAAIVIIPLFIILVSDMNIKDMILILIDLLLQA